MKYAKDASPFPLLLPSILNFQPAISVITTLLFVHLIELIMMYRQHSTPVIFRKNAPRIRQGYKAYLAFCMLFFLLSPIRVVCAGNDVAEIVIFIDQSASINDYDPKMVSRKWLTDFITTFNNTCKVTLFGFDDRLHKYGQVTIQTEKEVETLLEKISLIEAHGLTTNLEVPFQHLLKLDNGESLKVVVITSDWEPEIWDEKRWYLSKKVRDDQRYEDLTRQYYLMKSQGESPEQIYNKLHPLYLARNLELIEERLALVKERMGEKLFLLDIYGELEYFARWADILDADSISIPSQSELSVEESVRNALMVIEEKIVDPVQSSSPRGQEQRPMTASINEPSDKSPDSQVTKTPFNDTEKAEDQEQRQMTTSITESSNKSPVPPIAKAPFQNTEKAAAKKAPSTVANRDRAALSDKELFSKEKPVPQTGEGRNPLRWWLVLLSVIVIVLVIKYNNIILGPIAVALALSKKSKSLEKMEHEIEERQTALEKLDKAIAGKASEREALEDELKEHRADSLLRIESEHSAKKTRMEAGLQEEQIKREGSLRSELAERREREHETLEDDLKEHRIAQFSKIESELLAQKAEMETSLQEEQRKREEGFSRELAEKKMLEYEKLENEQKERRADSLSKIESEFSAQKAEMETSLLEEQKKREEGLSRVLAERRAGEYEKLEYELKEHRADVLSKIGTEISARKAEMEAMIQEIKTHPEEYLSRELAERRALDFEKLRNELEGWRTDEMETLRELDNEVREKKAIAERLDAEIIEKGKLRQREEYLKEGMEELRIAEMEKLDNEIQQKREQLQKELEEEFTRKSEVS